ncbi:acyltransferase family protein [Fulvivirga lutimaris]|uniref:acyltransferase family protein n=1 Tax=Fulvivirga lutimaris TaxID=1819566 RepID=UPI0012BC989C|nr:acyltransferase family protein [Fulvivirga lutimaris]MTI41169.1 2,3,4,5-tetrahydropyridine-2,6-carboxylate N-succinyltransferase [Fulvivirga lutimaris]
MVKSNLQHNRIYSFDTLRAVMMLLGIVLHSSESYIQGESDIWPRDPYSTDVLLNYINSLIHIFRMPIFFVMAGYFGSMLFYKRGPLEMLRNRIQRIALPFAAFLILLHPIIIFSLRYTSHSFGLTLSEIDTDFTWFPQITYHLWFLYYLILITATVFLLAKAIQRTKVSKGISKIFPWSLHRRFLFLFTLTVLIFLIMVLRWDYSVPTPLGFVPDLGDTLFLMLFYVFGWLLYSTKISIDTITRFDYLFTISAFLMFCAMNVWTEYIDDIPRGIIYAIITWLFVFGITGLFVRLFKTYSPTARYISDASYWVYLVHLPLTIFLPALLVDWQLPAIVKFLIVLMGTSAVCLVSYHYLVRSTFIGKFLNGRKY